jgi:NAD(P)H-hydrate repair Nnr-like enzyme with NAD(P)H-hydrate dehydratase domain
VKGSPDYIAKDGEILATVNAPDVPAMECIGGTGDTITGLVSALACAGYDLVDAALYAARINRVAGLLAHPTPATHIAEIIRNIPAAMQQVLKGAERVAA